MERIERALEIARLHRHRLAESAPVTTAAPQAVNQAVNQAAKLAAPVAPRVPAFAEAAAEEPALRLEDATLAELASRDSLRERYVSFPDEPGPATLAYKMLRTQVLRRVREHSMRCIGVVSAASGEGKTITAINLALSIALEPNQSVVLVDLDLRRPTIAATLMPQLEAGVETWFASGAALAPLCRRIAGFERLAVLPTIAPVPGSSEALASPATAELLKRLRAIPGEPLVLIDLPPVLLFDDVLAIAPLLDGVVLVVTEEQTRREDIQRVFELLRATPVIGTVLNASADAERRAC